MIWKRIFFVYIQRNFFINSKKMFFYSKGFQIILANLLWIFVWYVFRQKSNLNEEQVLIFLFLRIFSINILFFKNKFLKVLSIPGILSISFFILLGFLPLYQQKPDWSSFYLTQQIEYIFLWNPKNIEITEQSQYWEQKIIPNNDNQKLFFIESPLRSIILNEKINNVKENNMFVIKLPKNTIYIAYPWSKITIEKNGNNFIITKIYWKNEYYKPNDDTSVYIDNTNIQEQKNKSDFSLNYLINEYENSKIQYIIDQAWWIIITQPIYQKFSKKILDIAYIIRPNIYKENLENYELYKDFFGRKNIETNYNKEENWRNLMLELIQKWRQETRHFK